MQPDSSPSWCVFGASVQGASHRRSGLPNQDAIDWQAIYGVDEPVIVLALADGHGSAHFVRSEVGATFAVRIARGLLRELGDQFCDHHDPIAIKRSVDHHLPTLLVRNWRKMVAQHWATTPLTQAELAHLDPAARRRLNADPYWAYGSTLIAALVTGGFVLYVQLGDGDIVTVNPQGGVARPPLPIDADLFANATSSLCMEHAAGSFRSYFQPTTEHLPALIMLATDGYANSFASDKDFLQAAQDYLAIVRSAGPASQATLRRELGEWLAATSARGSGDDISVGIIYRLT